MLAEIGRGIVATKEGEKGVGGVWTGGDGRSCPLALFSAQAVIEERRV